MKFGSDNRTLDLEISDPNIDVKTNLSLFTYEKREICELCAGGNFIHNDKTYIKTDNYTDGGYQICVDILNGVLVSFIPRLIVEKAIS